MKCNDDFTTKYVNYIYDNHTIVIMHIIIMDLCYIC